MSEREEGGKSVSEREDVSEREEGVSEREGEKKGMEGGVRRESKG